MMEEVRELEELQDKEGHTFVFDTSCLKTSVQHAETHKEEKMYYCCEACDFTAVTENELDCHRGIAHGALAECSMVSSDITQRETQKQTFMKESVMGSSKDSASYVCKVCPFTTSDLSIFEKHMECLHSLSCVDSFDSSLGLDKYKNDILEEPINVDSSKPLMTEGPTVFPVISAPEQDVKQTFASSSQSSHSSEFQTESQKITKARKSIRPSSVNICDEDNSPCKTMMSKSSIDHQPKYVHQAGTEKSNAEANYSIVKQSDESYLGHFKTKGSSLDSLPLFSSSADSCNNGFISDPHNPNMTKPESFKDHRHVVVTGLLEFQKEGYVEEISNQDFSDDTAVVALQNLSSENKDEFITQHRSSCDIVEQGDCTTQAIKNETYNEINQDDVKIFPLFQGTLEDQEPGENAALSYGQNDGCHFEHEDGETDVSPESQDLQYLGRMETSSSKCNSASDCSDVPLKNKLCPYCPARFATAVGLSNHIRGHLNRARSNNKSRSVKSLKERGKSNKRQHVKGSGTETPVKQARQDTVKSDTTVRHICQLCGSWFLNRIGLSNHVRGHLRRFGLIKLNYHETPISVVDEMVQDEGKYATVLKGLNIQHLITRQHVAKKAKSHNVPQNIIPLEIYHNSIKTETLPMSTSKKGINFLNECDKTKLRLCSRKKNQSVPNKNKRMGKEKSSATSRKLINPAASGNQFVQRGVLPLNNDSTFLDHSEKKDLTVHSTLSCNETESRATSGSKKTKLKLPDNANKIYTLRCRFCDLLFQGPVSIQGAWIKHLQRHMVNATLPNTGDSMVEVTSPP